MTQSGNNLIVCVTTETRPLDRLGQLGEFEQDSDTDSDLIMCGATHGRMSRHCSGEVFQT